MAGGKVKTLDPCLRWILIRVVLIAEILAFLSKWHGSNVWSQTFVAHAR